VQLLVWELKRISGTQTKFERKVFQKAIIGKACEEKIEVIKVAKE